MLNKEIVHVDLGLTCNTAFFFLFCFDFYVNTVWSIEEPLPVCLLCLTCYLCTFCHITPIREGGSGWGAGPRWWPAGGAGEEADSRRAGHGRRIHTDSVRSAQNCKLCFSTTGYYPQEFSFILCYLWVLLLLGVSSHTLFPPSHTHLTYSHPPWFLKAKSFCYLWTYEQPAASFKNCIALCVIWSVAVKTALRSHSLQHAERRLVWPAQL